MYSYPKSVSACTGLISVLIFIVVTIISCNNDSKKISPELIENPATAGQQNQQTKVPEFTFKETKFHFGEVNEGDQLTHVFKFENSGQADLVISDVASTCGCTVAGYSKDPVKPGHSGEIEVTFDTKGRTGMQSKTITVLANTIPATKVLTISAEVFPRK